MSGRWVRIALPSVGVVVAAAAIALVGASNADRTESAWVANQDLPAGAVVAAQDVRQVSVRVGGDTFSVAQESPVGERTTHIISGGDLIRPDDVTSQVMAHVPVSLKLSPPLSVGSTMDIYAISASSSPTDAGVTSPSEAAEPEAPVLVARGVVVVDAGPPVVIEVPAQEEPLWVALASSGTELMATVSSGVDVSAGSSGYQASQAVQILNQLAQGDPASMPSRSPGAGGQ
jgi:hypothetical protein